MNLTPIPGVRQDHLGRTYTQLRHPSGKLENVRYDDGRTYEVRGRYFPRVGEQTIHVVCIERDGTERRVT